MNTHFKAILLTIALVSAVSTGCQTANGGCCADGNGFGQPACAGADNECCVTPRPLGMAVRMHTDRQEQSAERSDFVIHQHEWYQGGEALGPDGRRHVGELAKRMQTEPHPVVIEPAEPDLKVYPDLETAIQQAQARDQNRRMSIIRLLSASGAVGVDSRVVIATPQAEGLRGDESARVFRSLNIRRGGGSGGGNLGGGGGGGGFGGGGGGGFGGGGGGGFGGGRF